MVVNKTNNGLTSRVSLAGFTPAATAQVYRYSAANLGAIVREADLAVTRGGFDATFPGQSITLLVLSPDGGRNGRGDFNHNGVIDAEDVRIEASHWPRRSVGAADAPYDINADGVIDVTDIMLLVRDLEQPAGG